MAGHREEEGLAIERVEQGVLPGRDGRGARNVIDQGDLAEALAATTRCDHLPVTNDRDLAVGDHVEAVTLVALANDVDSDGTDIGSNARASDSSVGGGRAAKSGSERSSAISTTGTVA